MPSDKTSRAIRPTWTAPILTALFLALLLTGFLAMPVWGEEVNRIILEELCRQEIRSSSFETLRALTVAMKRDGAEAVALACTELGLLVDGAELGGLPVFDTTALHCQRAIELALDSSLERAGRAA